VCAGKILLYVPIFVYRVVVEKPEGRSSFERPRRRWEDNIKMNLREVRWGHGLDEFGSEQGQVAGSCKFDS
jgi:hypothetical protein